MDFLRVCVFSFICCCSAWMTSDVDGVGLRCCGGGRCLTCGTTSRIVQFYSRNPVRSWKQDWDQKGGRKRTVNVLISESQRAAKWWKPSGKLHYSFIDCFIPLDGAGVCPSCTWAQLYSRSAARRRCFSRDILTLRTFTSKLQISIDQSFYPSPPAVPAPVHCWHARTHANKTFIKPIHVVSVKTSFGIMVANHSVIWINGLTFIVCLFVTWR